MTQAEPPSSPGRPGRKSRIDEQPADRESRYRRAAARDQAKQGNGARGVLSVTFLEPEIVAMTPEQHKQAVTVLASMIVAWWQRQTPPSTNP